MLSETGNRWLKGRVVYYIILIFSSLSAVFIISCGSSCRKSCVDLAIDTLLDSRIRWAEQLIKERQRMGIEVDEWGRYDAAGRRHGLWFFVGKVSYSISVWYYISSIGYYWEGKPDSIWIYLDSDGRRRAIIHLLSLEGESTPICYLHWYLFDREGRDSVYHLCNGRGEAFIWIRFAGGEIIEVANLRKSLKLFTYFQDTTFGIGDTVLVIRGGRLNASIYPPRPRCFRVRSWIRIEGYMDWKELELSEHPYAPAHFALRLDKEGVYLLVQRNELYSDFYSFSYVGYDTTWLYVMPDLDSLYNFLRLVYSGALGRVGNR